LDRIEAATGIARPRLRTRQAERGGGEAVEIERQADRRGAEPFTAQ